MDRGYTTFIWLGKESCKAVKIHFLAGKDRGTQNLVVFHCQYRAIFSDF
jgi:hypothetical protein